MSEAGATADRSCAFLLGAVEPSGDALGAALMTALYARKPTARIVGCGGPRMAEAGLESLFPIEPLSVMGPVSAMQALPAAMKSARALARCARDNHVDAAVLIDSWAFSRLAAERIRRAAPRSKRFKYAAPQVWASRPGRAKTLAKLFDGVLALFEFEIEWFAPLGVRTAFVGNPTFQEAAQYKADAEAFRAAHDLGDAPLLAVLPGSRTGEVGRLLEAFRATVDLVGRARPELRVVVAAAPAVEAAVREGVRNWKTAPVVVGAAERYDAFAAADAALAASGTVTTELAIFETPMIVAYRVGQATAMWARAVSTTDCVTLINIAAERAVVPEFLQENCRPQDMAWALLPLLGASPERAAQRRAFRETLPKLGVFGPPAAARAAETILAWTADSS